MSDIERGEKEGGGTTSYISLNTSTGTDIHYTCPPLDEQFEHVREHIRHITTEEQRDCENLLVYLSRENCASHRDDSLIS